MNFEKFYAMMTAGRKIRDEDRQELESRMRILYQLVDGMSLETADVEKGKVFYESGMTEGIKAYSEAQDKIETEKKKDNKRDLSKLLFPWTFKPRRR